MSTSYSVVVERYAEGHYIKKFRKKYHTAWEVTWRALEEQFKRVQALTDGSTTRTEVITGSGDIRILKHEFRIAGPGKSAHASGNRCIVAVNRRSAVVHVLLVYAKGDIAKTNETAAWKSKIRENYPEYKAIF